MGNASLGRKVCAPNGNTVRQTDHTVIALTPSHTWCNGVNEPSRKSETQWRYRAYVAVKSAKGKRELKAFLFYVLVYRFIRLVSCQARIDTAHVPDHSVQAYVWYHRSTSTCHVGRQMQLTNISFFSSTLNLDILELYKISYSSSNLVFRLKVKGVC